MSFVLLGILNAQAGGGAAGNAMDLLTTTTLTSQASSINLTNISQDYSHLYMTFNLNTTRSGEDNLSYYVNGDINRTWHSKTFEPTGSVLPAYANSSTGLTYIGFIPSTAKAERGYGTILIPGYTKSSEQTIWQETFMGNANESSFGVLKVDFSGSLQQFTFDADGYNYGAGSTVSVYGVK